MIDKKMMALLGSLLLLAAAMPLATAHLTSSTGSATSELLTDDAWRGNGVGGHSDGVSGTYVNNPEDFYVLSSLFPIFIPDQSGGVTGDITLFPAGYFSGASALCDLEVLGPGTAGDPMDESVVDDGYPTHVSNGGSVPDGTWDDGGIGGACHTEDQYAESTYNTPGCSGAATAFDRVSGGQVFIGASCDETTAAGSSPSLSQCLINEAISGASPAVLLDCVETFVNGAGEPPVITCGSDSISDAINYGHGGQANGVSFPTSGCGGGSAVVFTFNHVSDSGVIPATGGWIDDF